MSENRGIFGNYSSTEVVFSMPEGEYPCEIFAMVESDSGHTFKIKGDNLELSEKEEQPKWRNLTPQIFGAARITAGPKKGKLIPFRFQGQAWAHKEDMTKAEIAKAGLVELGAYICTPIKNKQGKVIAYERLQSEERTQITAEIFNRFVANISIKDENGEVMEPVGITPEDIYRHLEDEDIKVNIVIGAKEYQGKKRTEPKFYNVYNESVVDKKDNSEEDDDDYGDA